MKKILIIKLGALGDVVRTTALLHLFKEDDVTWVTSPAIAPLLPARYIKRVLSMGDRKKLNGIKFDTVISLDDEREPAALATDVDASEIVGTYLNVDGKVAYTDSASEWFDMGLISRFGKAKADEMKYQNRKTYQEILFGMFGKQFDGEEYCLDLPNGKQKEISSKIKIGIEDRAGDRWATKRWHRYNELAVLLREHGYDVIFFQQSPSVKDYASDIGQCDLVITGDTLCMHLALALKKNVVCLFTCTSPHEIYDYKRMRKIVSPLLKECFYRKEYNPEALKAISLPSVFEMAQEALSVHH